MAAAIGQATLRWVRDGALTCPVLLLGDRSGEVLEQLARDVDKEVIWTEPGFYYYRLALNPVRGHDFSVLIYAPFDSLLAGFHPHTQWLVIASSGPNRDPTWPKWSDRLTRILATRDEVVVSLVGDDWLEQGWRTAGGRTPLGVEDNLEAALKPLARSYLERLASFS